MPESVLGTLEQLLGPGVHAVEVYEHSVFARLHAGARATTRPGRIFLSGRGADFACDAALLSHEYFHVLEQWRTGRLTRTRYVLESFRRGYWRNAYEVEAFQFEARTAPRLAALLASVRAIT